MRDASEALAQLGLGITEAAAAGCMFCGAKSLKIASNGTEFWHPATDCCAPTLVLQVFYRWDDLQTAERDLDRCNPKASADLRRLVEDLQSNLNEVRRALRRHVRNMTDFNNAVDTIREHARARGVNFGVVQEQLRSTT